MSRGEYRKGKVLNRVAYGYRNFSHFNIKSLYKKCPDLHKKVD